MILILAKLLMLLWAQEEECSPQMIFSDLNPPAVDHCGPRARGSVDVVSDRSHKLNEGLRGFRDAVVWPDSVVKLTDHPGEVQLVLLIRQD